VDRFQNNTKIITDLHAIDGRRTLGVDTSIVILPSFTEGGETKLLERRDEIAGVRSFAPGAPAPWMRP